MQIRPYQQTIIDSARVLMTQGEKSLLIQAPTGSGKTVLATRMLEAAFSKGLVAWFMCHRKEIIEQTSETFREVGLPHAIAAAGYPEVRQPRIQLASIQTMGRRHTRYRAPNLIIFDEAHHCAAGTWTKIYEMFPDAFKVGLTATPQRLDGRGLRTYFSQMILGPKVAWLIEQGYLSNYRLFAPSQIDTSGILTRAGDFAIEQLAAAADKP